MCRPRRRSATCSDDVALRRASDRLVREESAIALTENQRRLFAEHVAALTERAPFTFVGRCTCRAGERQRQCPILSAARAADVRSNRQNGSAGVACRCGPRHQCDAPLTSRPSHWCCFIRSAIKKTRECRRPRCHPRSDTPGCYRLMEYVRAVSTSVPDRFFTKNPTSITERSASSLSSALATGYARLFIKHDRAIGESLLSA